MERNMPRLTKRRIESVKPRVVECFIWCSSTPGFGIRIYPSGKKVFISQIRVGRATRRVKIGPYGPYTVEQARLRAEKISRDAAEGRDPQREKAEQREAISVATMCDHYLEAARSDLVTTRFGRPKRISTLVIDEGRIARHIKPLIGSLRACDVRPADIQRMADAITQGKTAGVFPGRKRGKAVVSGGPGASSRAVGLLGGVYSWAGKRGLVQALNPVRGVEIFRSQPRDKVLNGSELAALGESLANNESRYPEAVAAIRLIALTGLRREEVCGLQWIEIDENGQCFRLQASKTGRSVRPVGKAAFEILRALTRRSAKWVFPNRSDTGSADLKKLIAFLFDVAGLREARSHDLRRTFASIAADEGYGDSTIGELLGHARRGVTARHYIRRPDAALVAAADRVSSRMAAALLGQSGAEIVTLSRTA